MQIEHDINGSFEYSANSRQIKHFFFPFGRGLFSFLPLRVFFDINLVKIDGLYNEGFKVPLLDVDVHISQSYSNDCNSVLIHNFCIFFIIFFKISSNLNV